MTASTVSTPGDAMTMPAAADGQVATVTNHDASTLCVFLSGGSLPLKAGEGAVLVRGRSGWRREATR